MMSGCRDARPCVSTVRCPDFVPHSNYFSLSVSRLFVFLKTIINVKLRILAKRKSKEAYFALNNSKT